MALSGQNGKNASLLIHLLDERWTMEMLTTLAGRGRRYPDLYEALDGIAYKVRNDTLRRSERDGLIARHLDAGASRDRHTL